MPHWYGVNFNALMFDYVDAGITIEKWYPCGTGHRLFVFQQCYLSGFLDMLYTKNSLVRRFRSNSIHELSHDE